MPLNSGEKTILGLVAFYIALVVMIVSGWIMNIINLFQIETLTFSIQECLMVAGVVLFPLGGLMGWLV